MFRHAFYNDYVFHDDDQHRKHNKLNQNRLVFKNILYLF